MLILILDYFFAVILSGTRQLGMRPNYWGQFFVITRAYIELGSRIRAIELRLNSHSIKKALLCFSGKWFRNFINFSLDSFENVIVIQGVILCYPDPL